MIGLILGENDFPKQILKKIKNKKRYLIIDLSKKKIFKKYRSSYSVSLGQFGKIINILKENNCKKVLFAGKVKKPKFSKLRLDLKAVFYMPRIIKSSKLGDAAILKEIINIFKKENIKTISSLAFNPELTLKRGNYTITKPNRLDKLDINKAIKTLNRLGKYSFSQGVIVRNKKVIAIEGKGGTQKMLEGCKNKKLGNQGVLAKLPKQKQDLRIDLPTVGLQTLKQCKAAGLKGIILKSKQNVFLEKKNVLVLLIKTKCL